MTFSRPSIAKGGKGFDNCWELNRFCSLCNVRVVGIASRFVKFFVDRYSPKLIYSYSDNRWSEGELYKSIGFSEIHSAAPNYWYLDNDCRMHRFNYRKSRLVEFDTYDVDKTEWQIMSQAGFDRIWDCGNTKFTLTPNYNCNNV